MVQPEPMKEWVPHSVQRHIHILLDGDEREPSGWRDALAKAEDELAQVTRKLRAFPRDGDARGRHALSRKRVAAEGHVASLKANVGALVGLATDIRMKEAYVLLGKEFSEDAQWRGFVAAAWAANMDFSKVRQKIKRAREHNVRIAGAARDLADLLERTSEFGISWPSEFGDVATLLRTTDNHEMQDHNLGMWRVMRRHVLGERWKDVTGDPSPPDVRPKVSIRRIIVRKGDEAPCIDPAEQARAVIVYAWSVAPPLSALLRTLQICASDFEPDEYGMLKAAAGTRQHNPKTEYLRAFAYILAEERQIDITPTVMKAMAITSNVVMNAPDIDATYDDVRKALSR